MSVYKYNIYCHSRMNNSWPYYYAKNIMNPIKINQSFATLS